MNAYEREKIERILKEVEHLAAVIKSYLRLVDEATTNNIRLDHKPNLSTLRNPGSLFAPDSETGLTQMSIVFESAISTVTQDINHAQAESIEQRLSHTV